MWFIADAVDNLGSLSNSDQQGESALSEIGWPSNLCCERADFSAVPQRAMIGVTAAAVTDLTGVGIERAGQGLLRARAGFRRRAPRA